ncbi:DUF1822 family protein [Planktothrix sp. FACHB-1365]|uniref:DUF1822 family protein n=1 Tax=Planktothrix sp. FACHB-1365 TaxID=2692855 RepID=UPI001687DD67|nr:DUF1822 family protein [Planktothrix sp. FACHB-1365]MBD2481391.1 DUF1822 family protein [Planktothrix sp. FACHB-1365]
MVNNRFHLDNQTLPMLIPQTAHEQARQFARQHPTPAKREQVYFNTLAVWIVNTYLQWMEISTELNTSDSWNPICQLGSNIADLKLTGKGRLECRPVREQEQSCFVPAEVWTNRIGYVAIRIFDSLKEAEIIGFVKQVNQEEIPLTQFRPFEDFFSDLNVLQRLEFPIKPAQLSLWLADVFEAGWQFISSDLTDEQQAFAIRSLSGDREEITQAAKLIDLGVQLGQITVALLVAFNIESDGRFAVRVRLYPMENQLYLPPGVRLILLGESQEIMQEVPSRLQDNYIQLPRFKGQPGERFQIRVVFGEVAVTEAFQI